MQIHTAYTTHVYVFVNTICIQVFITMSSWYWNMSSLARLADEMHLIYLISSRSSHIAAICKRVFRIRLLSLCAQLELCIFLGIQQWLHTCIQLMLVFLLCSLLMMMMMAAAMMYSHCVICDFGKSIFINVVLNPLYFEIIDSFRWYAFQLISIGLSYELFVCLDFICCVSVHIKSWYRTFCLFWMTLLTVWAEHMPDVLY